MVAGFVLGAVPRTGKKSSASRRRVCPCRMTAASNEESSRPSALVDRNGVKLIQRTDRELDSWIGTNLIRWHHAEFWGQYHALYEEWLDGLGIEYEEEEDDLDDVDIDEALEREVMLFAAMTDYEYVDEDGQTTPKGFVCALVICLSTIFAAGFVSDSIVKTLSMALSPVL